MTDSLERIKNGTPTDDVIMSFSETKVRVTLYGKFVWHDVLTLFSWNLPNYYCQDAVGFSSYASEEQRYKTD